VLGRELLLKDRLEAAGEAMQFDYMLLDCPPSLGLLTLNALVVADEVIIPMQPHFLALQGVAKLLETVQLVNRRMNPKLKVSGIVLTMFDGQAKLSNEVVAELEGFIDSAKDKPLPWKDARIFSTRIRRNIKLAESPSFGKPITIYDSASNGAADYRALAKEVIAMSSIAPVAVIETSTPAPAPKSIPAPAPKTTPAQPGISVAINRALEPSSLKAATVVESAAPAAPANSSEVAA
jgi:chromosome partitioning protein